MNSNQIFINNKTTFFKKRKSFLFILISTPQIHKVLKKFEHINICL